LAEYFQNWKPVAREAAEHAWAKWFGIFPVSYDMTSLADLTEYTTLAIGYEQELLEVVNDPNVLWPTDQPEKPCNVFKPFGGVFIRPSPVLEYQKVRYQGLQEAVLQYSKISFEYSHVLDTHMHMDIRAVPLVHTRNAFVEVITKSANRLRAVLKHLQVANSELAQLSEE